MPLVKDTNGNVAQLGNLGPAQAVSVIVTSAQSTALSSNKCFMVRLVSTTLCHVAFGANPTATSASTMLIPNVPEFFAATAGLKIAVIRNAADGVLSITEIV